MPEDNLEIVRTIWRDFPALGVEGVLRHFDPGVEWVIDPGAPSVNGHDGLRRYFGELASQGIEVNVLPYDFVAEGDHVLVPGTIRLRAPQSVADEQVFLLYRLEGGLVVHARSYATRDEALRAMRVSG